jgi:hypothetical protein
MKIAIPEPFIAFVTKYGKLESEEILTLFRGGPKKAGK